MTLIPDQTRYPDQTRCGRGDLASAYASATLPASELAAARAHIATCPDCRGKLENLRPPDNRIIAGDATPMPEPLSAAKIGIWIGWVAIAAVLLVLTVSSLLVA